MKWRMSATSVYFTMILIPVAFVATGCELIGGLMPGHHEVIIDESTVEPELKNVLAQAKRLTLITSGLADSSAAISLEQQGGYEVNTLGFPGVPTPSQIRKFMETICIGFDKPDLVIHTLFGAPDLGGGTIIRGALTGRAGFETTGATDVLRCRDMWKTRFSLRTKVDQGIHNADVANVDQILGREYAKALMRIGGKLPPIAK